jgi:tetratricopeptide (TPR) repeat protein
MMETNPIDETKPVAVPPKNKKKAKKDKTPRGRWILLGILIILIFVGVGVGLGIRQGVNLRITQYSKEVIQAATTQFMLGEIDLAAGRLDSATKRFNYVVDIDPEFPGLMDKLAQIEVAKAMLATPTISVTSTPTLAPTPDTQSQEQRLAQAKEYLRGGNWQATLDTLNVLRKEDVNYHSVDVDGMFYLAYRNRGVDKILLDGKLEGGIYDLSMAEQYGPIDKEAEGYRQAARVYLTASAFWEVDWVKAAQYFSQAYASMPNMRDGSNWTAMERYRKSAIGYGDQLMNELKYCEGAEQYAIAATLGGDATFQSTLTAAQLLCSPSTATPAPVATLAPSSTSDSAVVPSAVVPSETPTTDTSATTG